MFERAILAPYKGCSARTLGCHAACPRYAAYLERRRELLAATFERKETGAAIFHIRNDKIRRS